MASIKSFDWQKHKSELDRLFFKSFPLVPRSVSGTLNLYSFACGCILVHIKRANMYDPHMSEYAWLDLAPFKRL